MLTKTVTLICFSLCYVAAFSERKQKNPGAACRVSVQAFNVISKALLKTIEHEVRVNPYLIPDQRYAGANSSYSITDIHVQNFQVPSSNFSFRAPNEIAWSLKNLGLSLAFDWLYKERILFMSIRDRGRANFSINGLSVEIKVRLLRNSNEQLVLNLTKCSAKVDKVTLDVDRAVSILLLRLRLMETMLESKTTKAVCDLVSMAVDYINRNPMPSKYPIFSAAGYGYSDLIFDYGLITDPIVTESHLLMNHRGRFMLRGDRESALLPAPKMTMPASKYMLTSAVTNHPFNTLFHAIMRSKYSSMRITRRNFSTVSWSPLNTSCDTESICFGSFVPQIAKRYPKKSATVLVTLTTRPDLTINKNSVTITAGYHIDFNVTEGNGTETPVLSLQLSTSFTGTAHIANSTLFTKLISVKLVFSSASSPFIKNNATFLKSLNTRADNIIAKYIQNFNKNMAQGSPFPTKYPYIFLQAVNPQLQFIPGNIIFNVDFDLYSPPN